MEELQRLLELKAEAEKVANEALMSRARALRAINEWGGLQAKRALEAKGITPGKSVVRMKVRQTRHGRILIEPVECILESVGRVEPPTMERGALGPNAACTQMWWCANFEWRNIRKDGSPGLKHDCCLIQGDTVEELVAKIDHVRDLA